MQQCLNWSNFIYDGLARMTYDTCFVWAKICQNMEFKHQLQVMQVWFVNTKVTKVLLLPLVPKGGSMEPPWENHFLTGILQWNLHHICTGHKKSQFCQKKKKKKIKCCTISKWRPNNRFLFQVISILAKFWKNTFPKEFFNEIWLKEGEYE